MKFLKPPKLELYTFLFSIPLIVVALHLILFEDRLWQDKRIWLFSFPLVFVFAAISWYCHIVYNDWVQRRYADLNQSRQRILLKALVLLLIMSPTILFTFFLYDHFHILGYHLKKDHLVKGLFLGFSTNIIFESLYEAGYHPL